MAQYRITDTLLTRIANAVRRIKGDSTKLSPSSIADVLETTSIVDTSNGTATADDVLSGKISYVKGQLVTGSLTLNNFRSGTAEPSDSLGDNGDWYLVTED